VQALEGRDVPAATALDLGAAGAAGTVGGAILRQTPALPASGDDFRTFLRVQHSGSEAGYNSDSGLFHMNRAAGPQATHALRLSSVPNVVVDGVTYREFVLDVNQRPGHPLISLDELRLYVGSGARLHGYDRVGHTLAGTRRCSTWTKRGTCRSR